MESIERIQSQALPYSSLAHGKAQRETNYMIN